MHHSRMLSYPAWRRPRARQAGGEVAPSAEGSQIHLGHWGRAGRIRPVLAAPGFQFLRGEDAMYRWVRMLWIDVRVGRGRCECVRRATAQTTSVGDTCANG
jgi:hypothetical protein